MVEKINDRNGTQELLIRKFQSTLRPRLYRALPEELILAPQQDVQKLVQNADDTTVKEPKPAADLSCFEIDPH